MNFHPSTIARLLMSGVASATVVALLFMIGSILLHARQPRYSHADRQQLGQIALALGQYIQDFDDRLPPTSPTQAAVNALLDYTKNDALFRSPDGALFVLANPKVSGKSGVSFSTDHPQVLFYEARNNVEGDRNAVYVARSPDPPYQLAFKIAPYPPVK